MARFSPLIWLLGRSVVFNSSAAPWTVAHQLLCPRDSPGKNIGMGSHFFPTQGLNLCLLHWQADCLPLRAFSPLPSALENAHHQLQLPDPPSQQCPLGTRDTQHIPQAIPQARCRARPPCPLSAGSAVLCLPLPGAKIRSLFTGIIFYWFLNKCSAKKTHLAQLLPWYLNDSFKQS